MNNINEFGAMIGELESKLKTHRDKAISIVEENQILQEKVINLDNQLQDLIRVYRDALDEEQQLDKKLTKLGIDKKAEDDLRILMEMLHPLGWTVLPLAPVTDEPPMYKFHFIQGYTVTIQIHKNRMKLIDMEPMDRNFENIQIELESSQDLVGLLMAIKKMATSKASIECS